MTKKQRKKYLSILKACLLASTSLIYFMLVYIGYNQLNTNLLDTNKYKGIVANRGIVEVEDSYGRATYNFTMDIKGLNKRLYFSTKSDKKYALPDKILVGDSVTIYYLKKEIVHLEKNSETLISINNYKKDSWLLIMIGLIAGLGTLVFVIYGYKKGKI